MMMCVPILLLEDDPMIRDLLQSVLSDEGHDVRAHASRDQLMSAASALPGALAVADFWGTSHQVLSDEERREIMDLARTVPTIIVSGRGWMRTTRAEDLGAVALMVKPFDIDDLCTLVGASVARNQAARAGA